MMKAGSRPLAALAPNEAAAGRAARDLARRGNAGVLAFSLPRYLRSADAPTRIVLCPAGRDPAADLAFLRNASRRLLWPAPGEILAEAIEGLLGRETPQASAGSRPRKGAEARSEESAGVFFVEGAVTPARARALLADGARRWIAVNARTVRIGGALFSRLRGLGVRWLALEPIEVVGVLASPALARMRSRWGPLLPPGARIWIRRLR